MQTQNNTGSVQILTATLGVLAVPGGEGPYVMSRGPAERRRGDASFSTGRTRSRGWLWLLDLTAVQGRGHPSSGHSAGIARKRQIYKQKMLTQDPPWHMLEGKHVWRLSVGLKREGRPPLAQAPKKKCARGMLQV